MDVIPPLFLRRQGARPSSDGLCFLWEGGMKTNVYIDGFNFYFGAVKGTPYKWLNPAEMCRLLLPGHQINRIKYFTARVVARPHNPQQPARQAVYLPSLADHP